MPSVLVTGAGQGLGLELARQYAQEGWRVYATCLDAAAPVDLQELVREHGDLSVHVMDVTNRNQVAKVAAELGDVAIDVLINNAGIKGGDEQPFGTLDYETWERVLRTNLLGPMRVAEAFVNHVARSERRLIVGVASGLGSLALAVDGTRGPPAGGMYYYRTAKSGLNMVTRTLSHDLAPRGITVVSIAPGHVKTAMGGADAPLEIAPAIAGVRKVIDGITPAQTGCFFLWDGSTYPW